MDTRRGGGRRCYYEERQSSRKRPSPQKEGEGQISRLEIRIAPATSRLWLTQAMPIVGVLAGLSFCLHQTE